MRLTGPACTEALSRAGIADCEKRAENMAGGVRVELRVRPIMAWSGCDRPLALREPFP